MKKVIIASLVLISLIGCGKKEKKQTAVKQIVVNEIPEGKKLLERNCFLCHNTTTALSERVAPPMVGIKGIYLKDGATREEFIKDFIAFSKNPSLEKVKMKHALEKHGLMPRKYFKDVDLTKMAEYVYDYQVEEPAWFKKHWKEMQGIPLNNSGKIIVIKDTKKTPAEIGLSYALGTKKVLGKNLMGTIQKKGTLAALKFCNHKAYPLTDSMSTKFKATIKRVSDKPRNPKNMANKKELAIIGKYKKMVADKADINPITEEHDGSIQFYYPIKTNSMCLQCHGKPKDQIKLSTLKELSALYPTDKAQGYDVNQVRGIWSINYKKIK